MRIVILLSVVLPLCLAGSVVEGTRTAAEFVEEELLSDGYEGKVIYSYPAMLEEGDLLSTWHQDVRVPFNSYLIFIDDMALANWEHPCRWVFVSPAGEMEIIELYTPPDDIHLMNVEFRGIPPFDQQLEPEPDPRQWLINWFVPNPQPNANPDICYAWLISGGKDLEHNYQRYYLEIQFLYLILVYDYGYLPENIVVCFGDGLDPGIDQHVLGPDTYINSNPCLDGYDLIPDFDYDATYSGIIQGYFDVAKMTGPRDHLFIMTTDHGSFGKAGKLPPEGILNLWNFEYLDDDIFKSMLDGLDCETIHVIMEQCFSGSFLKEVIYTSGACKRTFASAANAYEISWAGATFPLFDEWIFYWIGAMHGSIPPVLPLPYPGLPSNPDTDSNGYIDFFEAFVFARLWDTADEHPQYDDSPDGCGSLYYLGGEIPPVIHLEAEDNAIEVSITSFCAYPVPSFSSISISFNLEQCRTVDLGVYDLSGRCISTLASEQMNPGSHVFVWESDSAPAGTYLVRLSTETQMQVIKVLKVE